MWPMEKPKYSTDQRCYFITHAKSGTDFGILSHSIGYRLSLFTVWLATVRVERQLPIYLHIRYLHLTKVCWNMIGQYYHSEEPEETSKIPCFQILYSYADICLVQSIFGKTNEPCLNAFWRRQGSFIDTFIDSLDRAPPVSLHLSLPLTSLLSKVQGLLCSVGPLQWRVVILGHPAGERHCAPHGHRLIWGHWLQGVVV